MQSVNYTNCNNNKLSPWYNNEELTQMVIDLQEEVKTLKYENKELSEKINMLWNAPGMPGYELVQSDFEKNK